MEEGERERQKERKKETKQILNRKKLESLPLANCFAYIGKHMQNVFIQNMYQQKMNF